MLSLKMKPDMEEAQHRIDLFWEHEDTDRPMTSIVFPRKNGKSVCPKSYSTQKERWLDIDYRVEQIASEVESYVYYAEAMPVAFPNLGPEILSAWAGCGYEFGETTTWSIPCIKNWDLNGSQAKIDESHPLFHVLVEFTQKLLQRGKDSFITGLTDFHPGGDHLAALRGPEALAMDLIEYPDEVKNKLSESYQQYFAIYDRFVSMILQEGLPISTWCPITSRESMYIPSNDFSCMISQNMFREFFLDGIAMECRHYKHSIYHLDGPNALRHLDDILSISELNAVQWVPGAGNPGVFSWIDVYQKILNAGKSVQVLGVSPSDLDELMELLPAKGVWLCMTGIHNLEEAEAVMKKINHWK